ncbi:hypothetical protein J6590_099725 [Homalodisca vitripennis]|nr:hypothetical protein J6590_099725 [Homalodisca vitripennis]
MDGTDPNADNAKVYNVTASPQSKWILRDVSLKHLVTNRVELYRTCNQLTSSPRESFSGLTYPDSVLNMEARITVNSL